MIQTKMKKLNNTLMADFSIEAEMLPTGLITWARGQSFALVIPLAVSGGKKNINNLILFRPRWMQPGRRRKKSADMSSFYFLFDVRISLPPMEAS